MDQCKTQLACPFNSNYVALFLLLDEIVKDHLAKDNHAGEEGILIGLKSFCDDVKLTQLCPLFERLNEKYKEGKRKAALLEIRESQESGTISESPKRKKQKVDPREANGELLHPIEARREKTTSNRGKRGLLLPREGGNRSYSI